MKLLEKNPSWMSRLLEFSRNFPAELPFSLDGKKLRSRENLSALHRFLSEEIFAGTIGGTRFETLVCDAVLPLIAARSGKDFFTLWFHWFIGDAPAKVLPVLRSANLISRERPLCNGNFQAILQIFLTRK